MATLLHRRMSLVRFLLAAVLVASVLGGRVFPARAQAALSIVETGGDTAVVEGGAPDTYTVSLTSVPSAPVTVTATPASARLDLGEGPGVAAVHVFSVEAYDQPWEITVSAPDDAVVSGNVTVDITHVATGGGYDGVPAGTVVVAVQEDDEAGVTVQPAGLSVSEPDGSASLAISLTSQPTENVAIPVSAASDEIEVSPSTVTLTPDNWSAGATVAVTAVDDDVVDGTQAAQVTLGPAQSADAVYDGWAIPPVPVQVADDDAAGVDVDPQGITLTEGGPAAAYTLVLTGQPAGDVVVTATPGNADVRLDDAAAGAAVTRTFTTGNWATPQPVSVRAVDDAIAGGTRATTIVHAASGGGYGGVSIPSVGVTVEDDDSAGFLLSKTTLTVPEPAGSDSLSVALLSQPLAEVQVGVGTASDEIVVSPALLLFTWTNWEAGEAVLVGARDDDVVDGTQTAHLLMGPAVSDDGAYDGRTLPPVEILVQDDDVPGVLVDPTGLTLSEPDGSAAITISLTSQPTDDVTIPVGVAGDEISVSDPSVTLTPGAWPAGATVTVHVVDDAVADGTQTAQVLLGPAESTDPNYSGWTIPPVAVQVQDDDAPGVTVSPTALNILEGDTGEYTVVLGSEPQGVVVLTVTPSARLSVDRGLIEFTEGNWTEPQTVTVTAVDNAWAEGERLETIAHTVAGGEYDGVAVAPVEVTVTDDDTAGVHVTPTSLVLSEPDDTATVTITLTSGPRANVTVPVSTGSGEINVSPSTVTLTADRWNTGAEVTITVANDAIADGTQLAVVTLGPTQSADVMYQGLTLPIVQVDVTDDDVAGVLVDPEGVSVVEGGPPVTYTLALTSQPTADVTITASVAGGEVELVGDAARTFAPENWATPQEMAVRAVDDPFPDGHQVATVVHALAASGEYTGLEVAPVEVSVADNDRADVSIAPLSLRLVEGGAPGAYALSLTAPPEGAVAVDVQPDEGLDVGAGSGQTLRLVVPAEAWHLPQTVTVVAVDDDVAGDEREAWITHETTGGGYTDVAVERVRVVIEDHDRAGIRVVPAHIVVSEPNGTADLAISLATRPAAPVRIPLQATTDRCLVVPDLIDLNPWEWRDGETVTVRAVNDRVRTGDGACGIRVGPAVSGDRRYDGLTAPDVPVTVLDDEPEGPMSLPLLFLSQPAALGGPVLDPIANPDGDGTYEVTWSVAESAEVYLVEEASDPAFADTRLVYEGAEPRVAISDRGAGRLWYRARSRASWGELSGWSAPQYVDILWEREPNNAAHTEANGPLVPDLVYRGVVDGAGDPQDYFLIVLARDAALDVFLSDIPEGHNSDLVLRDAALGLVGYSGELGAADEHIATGALPAGRYYVQVYHRVVGGGSGAYTLRYTIR